MVRDSSARFSSESESAHSAIVSPKPLGACGAHSGCRSCRSPATKSPAAAGAFERPQRRDQPLLRRPELPRGRPPTRRARRPAPRASAFKSPPLSRKRRRSRATQAGGGSSATKWRASLVATNVRRRGMPAQVANGALAFRRRRRPRRSRRRTFLAPARATARERRSRAVRLGGWWARPLSPTAPAASRRLRRAGGGRSEAVDRPAGQHLGPARARPAACSRRRRPGCGARAARGRSSRSARGRRRCGRRSRGHRAMTGQSTGRRRGRPASPDASPRRGGGRGGDARRPTLELAAQPRFRVPNLRAIAGPGAKAEPVEGTEGWIHRSLPS